MRTRLSLAGLLVSFLLGFLLALAIRWPLKAHAADRVYVEEATELSNGRVDVFPSGTHVLGFSCVMDTNRKPGVGTLDKVRCFVASQ